MSVIRPRHPADPLGLEAAGTGPWEPGSLAKYLAEARAAVMATPAGLDLAQALLAEYDTRRPESRLFTLLRVARRIREAVDRLVIVAGGAVGPATRLFADACCHPFHNQLTRGERGGRPRLFWLDGRSGNDELYGLLDVVAPSGRPRGGDLLDRWAVLAADAPRDDVGNHAVVQFLLAAGTGSAASGGAAHKPSVGCQFVAVTAPSSRLAGLAETLGCGEWVRDVAGIDAPLGVFTAAGLLPAAIAGIDVVQLLKGAAAMWLRFTEAPVEVNPVLIDAACCLEAGAETSPERRFAGGGRALASLAEWHHHIRPCSRAAGLFVSRIIVAASRRDQRGLPPFPAGGDPAEPEPNAGCGERSAPALMPCPGEDSPAAAVTIRLPRLDEHALGQLLQLLSLSAAVEERLRQAV